MRQKKQVQAERCITAGNELMLLLLALAVGMVFFYMQAEPVRSDIFEKKELFWKCLPFVLLAAIAVVFHVTVSRLYSVLLAVSATVDQMVDGLLNEQEITAMGESGMDMEGRLDETGVLDTDDGIYSKICDKLKKLYDAKAVSIHKTRKEMRAVHTLVSDISHQVKTPAANIKIYTGLLERHVAQEECVSYVHVIKEQADRLDFLIKTLVRLSRLETKVIAPRIRSYKLLDIVASALGEVVLAAEEKQIGIETDCAPELVVDADEQWTAEAVFNILDNAVKYTDRGGHIQIRALPLQSVVSLEISDTGRGIRREELPLVFQRFYRSPDAWDQPGTGLGLALAREILFLEKGSLTAVSKAGTGSCFQIMLPKGKETQAL
ncbi:MAG: hypothetical protein K2N87_07385 [Eubacterium sp.]|nr:hypothetical protein [Eubacterium sp.]